MIINQFEKIVKAFGENTAIIDRSGEYSFRDLKAKALSIAGNISQRMRGEINSPVLTCLEDGFDYCATILGILYSGNFYVPVPLNSPKESTKSIIDSFEGALVITNLENTTQLIRSSVASSSFVILEDIENAEHIAEGYRKITGKDPVYIMHTSGSTGTPKGVIIKQESVYDHIRVLGEKFDIEDKSIICCKGNFAFDTCVPELFSMILRGSKLIIKRCNKKMLPKEYYHLMVQEMNEYRVNLIIFMTTVMVAMANADAFDDQKPLYLKQAQFGGDVMPVKCLNYWKRHLPDVQYSNVYGPTEITDVCTYYIVDREFEEDDTLPVGFSFENCEVFLLNEALKKVLPGEKGEIYVRGTRVAAGYWKKPEETKRYFIQNPLIKNYKDICYKTGDIGMYNDRGEIIFVGRQDSQIKFRGNRVELGAIEIYAGSLKGIHSCFVHFSDKKGRIILFYEADCPLEKTKIIKHLFLRTQIIPHDYIYIKNFERLENGKIDKKTIIRKYL